MITATQAVQQIRARVPDASPRIAVVLGSGWSSLTRLIDHAQCIPYAELAGFPVATVEGHQGALWLGRIGGSEVAVLSGRRHVYESGDEQGMKEPLAAMHALGCKVLVQSNAAGSLHAGMAPGSLMLVSDHVNLSQRSPLIGETGTGRFVDMCNAYDDGLRAIARTVAAARGIALHEGVYAWNVGPQFETPAEIRMFQRLGADAVGMSTVPETILARRLGLRVLAISMLTNMAAGLSAEALSHARTLAQADAASGVACGLLAEVIAAIAAAEPR